MKIHIKNLFRLSFFPYKKSFTIRLELFYGKPTQYSNKEKPKTLVFAWQYFRKHHFEVYDVDYSEGYFLEYHDYYDIRENLLEEYNFRDRQTLINELMRRTNYQIPISIIREDTEFYFRQ